MVVFSYWGCIFLAALLSFFFDTSEFFIINGEKVETTDQKLIALSFAIIILSISFITIFLSRISIISRSQKAIKLCSWFENMPIYNRRLQITILVFVAILSVIPIFGSRAENINIVSTLMTLPISFFIGMFGSLVVLGFQVINPFCPKSVLRFFALITIAFFGLGAFICLPILYIEEVLNTGLVAMPISSLGFASGAIVVLRKWAEFKPITEGMIV